MKKILLSLLFVISVSISISMQQSFAQNTESNQTTQTTQENKEDQKIDSDFSNQIEQTKNASVLNDSLNKDVLTTDQAKAKEDQEKKLAALQIWRATTAIFWGSIFAFVILNFFADLKLKNYKRYLISAPFGMGVEKIDYGSEEANSTIKKNRNSANRKAFFSFIAICIIFKYFSTLLTIEEAFITSGVTIIFAYIIYAIVKNYCIDICKNCKSVYSMVILNSWDEPASTSTVQYKKMVSSTGSGTEYGQKVIEVGMHHQDVKCVLCENEEHQQWRYERTISRS